MEVYRFWVGRQKQSFPSLERNSIFEIRSPFPNVAVGMVNDVKAHVWSEIFLAVFQTLKTETFEKYTLCGRGHSDCLIVGNGGLAPNKNSSDIKESHKPKLFNKI